ncbi:MAG: ECF-type sigma factor [Acidobacteriota bacterium]
MSGDLENAPKPSESAIALLDAWNEGDRSAGERLISVSYPRLRRIAQSLFAAERQDHTLQPAALVNEAYFRLRTLDRVAWRDREHFLSMAARVMRRVLVDHARSRQVEKRGAGLEKAPMEELVEAPPEPAPGLVDLQDALTSLQRLDPLKAKIVELQYFGGLSYEQIARDLGCSRSTVIRQWKVARGWLMKELACR